MDLKLLIRKCLSQASEVIAQVQPTQYHDPTPDTEWDVHQLIQHILYELSWASDILEGKTISEVGNKYDKDLIGNDLQNNWSTAAKHALASLKKVTYDDIVYLSFGEFMASYYIPQIANDLLIHSWDLGQAIKYPVQFDNKVANFLYEAALPQKQSLAATGLFAAAVEVPDTANSQTKLLALFGRKS